MSLIARTARYSTRQLLLFSTAAVVFACTCLGVGIALGGNRTTPETIATPIDQINFTIPRRIATIPLIDQFGRSTDLAAFRGRYVVLADFMTSCQEECPITTGALLQVRDRLAKAKLLGKVAIVEVTVDPARDVPSRMLAYSKRFGVPLTFLTGSSTDVTRFWKYFGAYYKRVKEGSPPDINWQNGQPYTYDVVHTDDVFVIDSSGHERAVVQSDANVNGKLPNPLASLLDADGRADLKNPGFGSWTPAQMFAALTKVMR
jgi:cytochrome oxidase Cu insertion factor (SCO1/SenC/PrrC family)